MTIIRFYGSSRQKALFASIFLILSACPVIAQNTIDEWGQGIISRVDEPVKSEIIDFPVGSLKIYDAPAGNCIGKITKDKEYSTTYNNVYIVTDQYGDSSSVKREDLREVTYEGTCLKYYETRDGYVRAAQYAIDGGVWIAIDELKAYGFAPLSWLDFLLKKKVGFLPKRDSTLSLKDEPSATSTTIIEMVGDSFVIDFTGNRDGYWLEVRVSQYSQPFFVVPDETPKQLFGWVLAIDVQGHPRVWFYTRGC